jgi:amino acid transporter
MLFGAPRDVHDPHVFHNISLIALLAWVGLGADGLSSSAYGPDEAFRALGEHRGLALFLALATALTVAIISTGYSRIIARFPSGGGGYVVASKLLGPRAGVVSGAALLVDYVLTVAISMASGADAIFSFLPVSWHAAKLPVVFAGLLLLTVLNLRGVKESVSALVPVFGLFLVTHAVLLCAAIGTHLGDVGAVTERVGVDVRGTVGSLGLGGTLALFARAYSLGGGTYTGIEAVSNGVGMMREPKVRTAQRTMVLMAVSLAVTAGGLLLAYLLADVRPAEGMTMNAVLVQSVAGGWSLFDLPLGGAFVVATLASEGALLFVAAQAGFLDGPRVMANMATDSWLPHRFASLSNRLVMRNGVTFMSVAAGLALLYTDGDVRQLVVMYSINVFATFAMSNLAMLNAARLDRRDGRPWRSGLLVHLVGFVLCVGILGVTIFEKFLEGGWVTLLVTATVVAGCLWVRAHYEEVRRRIAVLDPVDPLTRALRAMDEVTTSGADFVATATHDHVAVEEHHVLGRDPDPDHPVAVLFVGSYGGLGRRALWTLRTLFGAHFAGIVFVHVAVVDSDTFKGADQLGELEGRARADLLRYEQEAVRLGFKAASAFAVGTDVPDTAEQIARDLAERYPGALFVGGQILFDDDARVHRMLHNETALMVQQRLQRAGLPMFVLPVQLDRPSEAVRA